MKYEYLVRTYAKAESVQEALNLLAEQGWEPVAVGQDQASWSTGILVVMRRARK